MLDEEAEKTRKAGLGIVEKHRRNGRPDEQIVALAEELEAGLGGMKRALVGSVSDSVVRHAHCPVLVARGGRLH